MLDSSKKPKQFCGLELARFSDSYFSISTSLVSFLKVSIKKSVISVKSSKKSMTCYVSRNLSGREMPDTTISLDIPRNQIYISLNPPVNCWSFNQGQLFKFKIHRFGFLTWNQNSSRTRVAKKAVTKNEFGNSATSSTKTEAVKFSIRLWIVGFKKLGYS